MHVFLLLLLLVLPTDASYKIGFEIEMPVFMAKIKYDGKKDVFVPFVNREVVWQEGKMAVTVDDAADHSIVGSAGDDNKGIYAACYGHRTEVAC